MSIQAFLQAVAVGILLVIVYIIVSMFIGGNILWLIGLFLLVVFIGYVLRALGVV